MGHKPPFLFAAVSRPPSLRLSVSVSPVYTFPLGAFRLHVAVLISGGLIALLTNNKLPAIFRCPSDSPRKTVAILLRRVAGDCGSNLRNTTLRLRQRAALALAAAIQEACAAAPQPNVARIQAARRRRPSAQEAAALAAGRQEYLARKEQGAKGGPDRILRAFEEAV